MVDINPHKTPYEGIKSTQIHQLPMITIGKRKSEKNSEIKLLNIKIPPYLVIQFIECFIGFHLYFFNNFL